MKLGGEYRIPTNGRMRLDLAVTGGAEHRGIPGGLHLIAVHEIEAGVVLDALP